MRLLGFVGWFEGKLLSKMVSDSVYDLTCAGLEHMGTLRTSVASRFSCAGRRFLSLPGSLSIMVTVNYTAKDERT